MTITSFCLLHQRLSESAMLFFSCLDVFAITAKITTIFCEHTELHFEVISKNTVGTEIIETFSLTNGLVQSYVNSHKYPP